MMRNRSIQVVIGFVAFLVLLALMRNRTLNRARPHDQEDFHHAPVTQSTGTRQSLTVAFLPVTCHLTCPVTDFASKTSTTGTTFDAMRFGEFPSIVEALKTKKLLAGFITVPLAMKMREQGAPIRICCLGHRDGSQLTVRKESDARNLHDLTGKTIAIPSPFSNENFLMNQMMREQGVKPGEIKFVVLPPPDMNAALSAKAIDGFIVAEPFCGKAEMDGYGRVLYYAKDVWPNYISCCLVVHEDLIRDKPDVVRDLVRGIIASGEWAQKNRLEAAKLVAPAFHQNVKLLTYVLTQPADRVTYTGLNPTDAEMQKIMDMGISLGFLKKKVPMTELMDRSFIGPDIVPAKIDMSRMSEMSTLSAKKK